jgi:uncharacterized protein YciI
MAHFFIYAVDKPNHVDVRLSTRPVHLEHLAAHKDRILVAGPTLDDSGQPVGSVFLVEFPDINSVEKFLSLDPYAKAGLFESVTIKPWRKTIPAD